MNNANEMSTGQKSMLNTLGWMVARADNGMHRVHVVPRTNDPLICHFGKSAGEVLLDGDTWDKYVLVTGDELENEGSILMVTQTFTDINPRFYGDLDNSKSGQVISGHKVSRSGKVTPMSAKDLMKVIPFRSDIQMSYK